MSISINKISKAYNNELALNNISFNIKKGEIVGFLGPNGAGKSTLMKIVCGSLKQDKGEVSVCKINSKKNMLLVKSKIGYLSEKNPLYLDMYVKEYLTFIGNIYNIKNLKDAINNIVLRTGLSTHENKKIIQLSKGYKQRVGLAAALIHEPEVLILDEPTTGLDPNQLDEIRNLVTEFGKEKTVLLSTHIMQEVDKTCDRVIIINKGVIVADNLMSQLRKDKVNLEEYFRELTSN